MFSAGAGETLPPLPLAPAAGAGAGCCLPPRTAVKLRRNVSLGTRDCEESNRAPPTRLQTCAGMAAQRCVWLGRDLAELLRYHHQVKKRRKGAEARGECSHHAREGIVHTLQFSQRTHHHGYRGVGGRARRLRRYSVADRRSCLRTHVAIASVRARAQFC